MYLKDILEKKNQNAQRELYRKELLSEITDVEKRLTEVQTAFDMATDNDLIESLIYEERCLKTRHRYLVQMAKKDDITGGTVTRL